jgi:hypothetical protein
MLNRKSGGLVNFLAPTCKIRLKAGSGNNRKVTMFVPFDLKLGAFHLISDSNFGKEAAIFSAR